MTSGYSTDIEIHLAKVFSVNPAEFPQIWILDFGESVGSENVLKYQFKDDTELTGENIVKFVDDFYDKKLTPYFKSEALPKKEKVNGITKIVGSTFIPIVNDTNLDVMVSFE